MRCPSVAESIYEVEPGDLLVLVTDGVRLESPDLLRLAEVTAICDDIMHRCRRGTDDALVLVARYVGE